MSSNASLLLGGELKRREFISGRYADMLSYLIAGYAMEWHATHQNLSKSSIHDAAQTCNLHRLMVCAENLIDNHPHSFIHRLLYLRTVGGARFKNVTDEATARVAKEMMTDKSQLRMLFEKNTVSDLHPNIARINKAIGDTADMQSLYESILRVDTFRCVDASGKALEPAVH